MNTHEIRISRDMLQRAPSRGHVHFGPADRHTGAQYMGTFRGEEQVGDWVTVRKQVGPQQYQESRVEVIDRQTLVTGDVILVIRESATVARNAE